MLDLRKKHEIKVTRLECLQDRICYKYCDDSIGKMLVVKVIDTHEEELYIPIEFNKLICLSAEPEIATVYYLAVAVFDDGTKSDCYVMDYVEGNTFEDFVKTAGNTSYELFVRIILDISNGLEKSHFRGITHSDLHDRNIIVNDNGHAIILDYCWFEFNDKKTEKDNDLRKFKDRVKQLYDVCPRDVQERASLVYKVCQKADSFVGLGRRIEGIDRVSFDLLLLGEEWERVLSWLIRPLDLSYRMGMAYERRDIEVPDRLSCRDVSGIHLEMRRQKILAKLKSIFSIVLDPLKQLDICNWRMCVENKGKPNKGPYVFSYQIFMKPKAFVFWDSLGIVDFLPPQPECELHNLIWEFIDVYKLY